MCFSFLGKSQAYPPLPLSREQKDLTELLGYRQKCSCCTPNSFVMVNYKTFNQKHYIVFVKICPPTGQITFLARAQRKMP